MLDVNLKSGPGPFEDGFEPATLIELLQHRALRQPDKLAYSFLDDSGASAATLSYRELDLRARSIAVKLRRMNAVGERILLLYSAGLDFHAAFFGCLYAGAIAVPAYPPRMNRNLERLIALIDDAEARVVLTTSGVMARLRQTAGDPIGRRRFQWLATDEVRDEAEEWCEPGASSRSLAFLQYTSGSTGAPRGVRLTHANLLHNAWVVYEAGEHRGTDKYVSWLPTFHDMGFMVGLLEPLYAGIPAVLMSPTSFLQSPVRWLEAISQYRATLSGGPNFAYCLCAMRITPQQRASLNLESWRVAFNGAEPIQAQTLSDFAAAFASQGFKKSAFFPCYGLAEATLMVSGGRGYEAGLQRSFNQSALEQHRVVEMDEGAGDARPLVSCGRVLGGQKVAIVEPQSHLLCRRDEVGEIWISGPSVADGYWNQAEQSQSVFGASLAPSGDGPYLRTGDLGFLYGDELYVTSRLKDLIIIRGVNHYPQDIEQTVENLHPAFRPGCGAAFSIEIKGEERLVIVQEVEKKKEMDTAHLIDLIRQGVSREHELQAHAVVLIRKGTIPKSSSGKIQRRACKRAFLTSALAETARDELQERELVRDEPSFILKALLSIPEASRPPLLEVYLQEQVARLLGARDLRNDQPLVAYGLDSLNAAEFKNAVKRDLGGEVSLARLLEGASIRDLSQEIAQRVTTPGPKSKPIRDSIVSEGDLPLSYMQQSLWVAYQLAPSSPAYNVAVAVQIEAAIDRQALCQALQELVDRRSCLRTTFSERDGSARQIVARRREIRLEEEEAIGWDDARVNERIVEHAHQPFDLENGPVFRAVLFKTSDRDHMLLLTAHHIVIDGRSMWVLLDELFHLYQAHKSGGAEPLKTPPADYGAFVRWQAEIVDGPEGEAHLFYWRTELDRLPTLDFPIARRRPTTQTFAGAEHRFSVDRELTEDLRRLAASNGTTLYITLLSVFEVLLHHYTGANDLVVGTPVQARPKAEFEDAIGCFFNVMALRTDFHADPSFRELLAQTRHKTLSALEHQDYPSHLLAQKLQIERDPSRSPLFQTTFIYQKPVRVSGGSKLLFDDGLRSVFGDLTVRFSPVERRFARNDLELEILEAENRLFGSLQFNTDLFLAADAASMVEHYGRLLRAVVVASEQRVSKLSALGGGERRRVLSEWSAGGGQYTRAATVSVLLDEQAAKTPGKIAAVYEDLSLTYSQLNGEAEKLAHLIEKLSAL